MEILGKYPMNNSTNSCVDYDALTANIMEYNSHDKNGKLLDLSKRHKIVKILDKDNDFELIKKYSDYKYVLGEEFKEL